MGYSQYSGEYDKGDHIDTGIGGKRVIKESIGTGVFGDIPVIDLTDASSPSLEIRKRVAKEIYDASVNVGFFYIKNHSVRQDVIDGCFKEAKRFFHDLSTEDKMALDITKNTEFYGYAPIQTQMPQGATKRRVFESINFGYEPTMDPGAQGTRDNGPSFWPPEEKLPQFKENIGRYYYEVMGLCRRLLKLFALGLDLEEDFFDQFCKRPGVLLKLNHYPAAIPESSDNAGIHAHSDLESESVYTVLNLLISYTKHNLPADRLYNSVPGRRQIT